jgi:hypothetical protein
MITVRLLGGLGNQLFQYASGRAVALRHGTGLRIDRRAAVRFPQSWAQPALHHFAIKEVEGPLPPDRDTPLRYALWRKFGRNPRFLRESGLGVNAAIMNAPDNTYIQGYLQSETYFTDAEAQIRQDLTIITPPSAQNAEWLERIAATPNSVAVHLRRGDYISSAKGAAAHGTCNAAYYDAALRALADRTGITPNVFVFSNDPAWCEAELALPFPKTVVGHNSADDHYEDMRLMAACRHHVIANSTFSWWGAWLGTNTDKEVMAPARWFGSPTMQNPDIIPARWHRIDG